MLWGWTDLGPKFGLIAPSEKCGSSDDNDDANTDNDDTLTIINDTDDKNDNCWCNS